jgi:hypothetical protein
MTATIFVSTQPDTVYFHWQVELYLYQFAKHGPEIARRCYALFGYQGATPSAAAVAIAERVKPSGAHILFYKDDRNFTAPNFYIPTIRPHLMKKFFAEHPELGASVFVHDSDIFLVKVPRFELLLNDDVVYMSDTLSYIGYHYIRDCQGRYKAKYPQMPDDDLLKTMCDCVGIPIDVVKANQAGSGGAQYLLKNTTVAYWTEAETLCQKLYDCLVAYDRRYPLDTRIQLWTAEMWVVLWLLWKGGVKTKIHSDLDFSWATFSVAEYHKTPIFHLAGITEENRKGRFFKGAYVNRNVFTEYLKNKAMFDDIDKNSATYEYVRVIKEYAEGSVHTSRSQTNKTMTRFLLDSKEPWMGVYEISNITFRTNPVWRSADGRFIIFNTGAVWVLTAREYETTLSPTTGGFASTSAEQPYDGGWNHPCTIRSTP